MKLTIRKNLHQQSRHKIKRLQKDLALTKCSKLYRVRLSSRNSCLQAVPIDNRGQRPFGDVMYHNSLTRYTDIRETYLSLPKCRLHFEI